MSEPLSKPLKHVIIGAGAGVLAMHRPALEQGSVHVVGVSDISTDVGRARADAFGCPFYADVGAMLRETAPDVAVVLTPHPFHAAIAAACLEAGAHVLVEKPIAVEVAEADAMIQAAARAGRLLAVNFQHRFRPEVRAARQILEAGRLGELQHVDLTASWPRTACYFRAASWRGTWAGEGGGVLMNQAPHNLDLLCYLLGLPERVVAWTRTTLHATETEDTVQAMLEWPEGTLGSVHISTAEAGRPERLELVGTGGTLSLSPGGLSFNRCETDFRTFVQESDNPFGAPTFEVESVATEAGGGDHAAVYRNLHEAITRGAPLLCDGAEGRKSLELANAMILSSYTRREVPLPLDRSAYAGLLAELKAGAVAAR